MKRPTIGRVVHYVSNTIVREGGTAHRAAIVTEESTEGAEEVVNAVGLAILNPEGMWFKRSVPQDRAGQTPGTWHWCEGTPEDVAEKMGLS